MAKRLVLGIVCACVGIAGCGGDMSSTDDAGTGTDSATGVDSGGGGGVDSGLDSGLDAFTPMPDTGLDAATTTADGGSDAGMTSGCELGDTYPDLRLTSLHRYGSLPVGIVLAPGRDDLFVVLRGGTVVITDPTTGATGATPFLDISSRLGGSPSGMAEYGLLGLAFHPDYETNGLFYIAYTARVGGTASDCMGTGGTAYEDRLAVGTRSTGSADVGTFGSDIFTITDPRSNHNGGQLGFGPDDGMLYYGVGDGGEQGDPCHRALDTSVPLGKIHRFEVGPGIATYNPAPGNPFIGGGGLATIWAYGVRNPWRFTWDRMTHDMFIGDVGQDAWEEVDVLPMGTAPGANLGWSTCEGTHDYNGSCAGLTGDVAPIAEYSHSDATFGAGGSGSITGGYVYRGSAIPGLRGAYLFGDEVSSAFGALRHCPGAPVTLTPITFGGAGSGNCGNPTTFGEDRAGELLVACYADSTVYRIAAR